jgi:hypothetical protein
MSSLPSKRRKNLELQKKVRLPEISGHGFVPAHDPELH